MKNDKNTQNLKHKARQNSAQKAMKNSAQPSTRAKNLSDKQNIAHKMANSNASQSKNLNPNDKQNLLPFGKPFELKRPFIKSVRDYLPINESVEQSLQIQSVKEQRVLKVSMISALVLAVFGVGFGVWAKSLAVVFDGFVCLVSVGLGALSVVTSRYIYKDDDEIFQFGYVRFEPMVNLFKSIVLVLVCVYAFINAVSSLFSSGYEVEFGGVAVYSGFALVFCFVLFIYTRQACRALESDLIRVDNTEWKIDCALYAGAIAAFGLVYLSVSQISALAGENLVNLKALNATTNALNLSENLTNLSTLSNLSFIREFWLDFVFFIDKFSHYIDPFLLAVLSLALCVSPLKIAVANFKDLVMLAPPALDERITQLMQEVSAKHGFKDYDTHTAKSGRFFMVEINILVDRDFAGSVASLDTIREEIEQALAIPSYKIWLSISFTTKAKWL